MELRLCHSLRTAVLLACCTFPGVAFSLSPRLLDCVPSPSVKPGELLCEIDGSEAVAVESVRQRAQDGSLLASPAFLAGASEGSPTAVALLLNSGLEDPLFARAKTALAALLTSDSRYVQAGLWVFATNVQNIAPLGTGAATLKAALDGQRNRGVTIELLRSINETAKQLSAGPRRRKLLVVASDGEFDDSAYRIPEITKSLRESDIRIVVFFPESGPEKVTRAQGLRRLADETDGLFLPVANSSQVQAAVKQLNAFIANSGSVVVERHAQASTLEVVLKNGRVLAQPIPALDVKVEPPSAPPPVEPPPPPPLTLLSDPIGFAKALSLYSWMAIGAALLAIIGLGLWFVARARQRAAAASRKTQTVGDLRPILGWFEFFDSQSTREPIHQSVTRIGRNRENDLVLNNSSVHRFHAVLSRDPAGKFTIVDLDTANGVRLNGVRVKSKEIGDGDVVELGEVRMRFNSA
jgi:hypothetical protein